MRSISISSFKNISYLQLDIFFHFKFRHNRRNGLRQSSYPRRKRNIITEEWRGKKKKKNSQGLQTHKTIFQFSEGDIYLWSLCSLLSPSQFCSTHWSVAETKGLIFDYIAMLCRVCGWVTVGVVQPLSHSHEQDILLYKHVTNRTLTHST